MISIDTNVLLRYLLQDDEKQAAAATQLISGSNSVLITDIVLAETVWTLKGKRYNISKSQIIDVIHGLFAEPNIVFEDGLSVWGALRDYTDAVPIKSGGKVKQADFPDALIVNKAMRHSLFNNNSVTTVYTFDKAALQIHGTALPS
ncbi:PIN domain-containing protein [Alteromonas confluentis]|uniref:Twitching motility protein PilT n=1 Tax=Alteromonas confluentis TaxID=1656094 RepID=A0A1E7ZBT3_9ALTE|nr:type II toxin-antitoxin system VapC family toxin [Alteromonas confluentis]OFC70968.1 twitching motility protein PilT [Alteromonas confluentis]